MTQVQRAAEEEGRSKLEELTKGLEAKMQGYRLTMIDADICIGNPPTAGFTSGSGKSWGGET